MKLTVHQITTLNGRPTEVFVATAHEITGSDLEIITTAIFEKKLQEQGYSTSEELSHIPLKPIGDKGGDKFFLSGGTHPKDQWRSESEWAFIKA